MSTVLQLTALAALCFLQNVAFTWSSRTRNQNDTKAHRWAALCANGIWFAVSVTIWKQIWAACTSGDWWLVVLTGAIYTAAATESSVAMMGHMIRRGK